MKNKKRGFTTERLYRSKLYAEDLSASDVREILDQIVNTMWPEGDEEAQWSPDTLDAIADTLYRAGLMPEPTE